MKPNPTKAKAAATAARSAVDDAKAALEVAEKAKAAADLEHRIHLAAAGIAGNPRHIARLRALVARGSVIGHGTPTDRLLSEVSGGLACYSPAERGWHRSDAKSSPGNLAVAVLALLDAPEPSP
jgi:hypothetical protein